MANMLRRLLYILAIALPFFIIGCSSEKTLTTPEAMEKFRELSPKGGADYYLENREQYSFLDTLYQDSIMPAVLQCNYFDLDSVRDVLSDTPFKADIDPVYLQRRDQLLQQVEKELGLNATKQKKVFDKFYLPYLEMSIDSMIDEDVDKVMSKYAGGFLNFRKLAFFFGRGRNDFKQMFWEKFDTVRYQSKIKEYVYSFYDSVKVQQDEYCKGMTGSTFKCQMRVVAPSFRIGLTGSTLSYVKHYTSKQTSEMVGEAIKDYAVPLLLDVASGGAALVYDIGNTAYDVNEMVNEVKNMKVDDDEMVKYICSHDLSYQIRNYYIDLWTSQVYKEIDRSNKELFNYIQKNL